MIKKYELLEYILTSYVFCVIFSNVIPGLIQISYVLALFSIIFSLSQSKKISLFCFILFIILICVNLVYLIPSTVGDGEFREGILNSKFLVGLLFIIPLSDIYKRDEFSGFISHLGFVFKVKLLFLSFLILVLTISPSYSSFFNFSSAIKINQFSGYQQVYDKFLYLMPLFFFNWDVRARLDRYVTLVLVSISVLASFTLSYYLSLFLILSFIYRKHAVGFIVIGCVVGLYFLEDLTVIYNNVIAMKQHSFDVKYQQYAYFYNSLGDNVLGKALGAKLEFFGFQGYLIENFFIYIILIYGVIFGGLILLVLLLPFLRFKHLTNHKCSMFLLLHAIILLNSFSNPYIMSPISFLFIVMVFFVAFSRGAKV